MSWPTHWFRELSFLRRDRSALIALFLLLFLSGVAVMTGLNTIAAQERDIAEMIEADATDRRVSQAPVSTFGDAAYYSFYAVWDEPDPLAFAAIGQRDTAPYLKRIRMLALEGQIYQGESPNPLLAQIGSLDVSFIAAYVLPLVIIALVYDLMAGERSAGRLMLLEATPSAWARLWLPRILWRSGLAFMAVAVPFLVGALVRGASAGDLASALIGFFSLAAFWTVVSTAMACLAWRASSIGAGLVGIWLTLNVFIPAGVQTFLVPAVQGPDGADIALIQREAVNDAWDLPKAATLEPFAREMPRYTISGPIKPFDWRWYYAFQHMGDVAARPVSEAYRDAIRQRDFIASRAAWLSPALAIQRHLQRLGGTDVKAQLAFDASIRRYHAAMQDFYLPLVFGETEFDRTLLKNAPRFDEVSGR